MNFQLLFQKIINMIQSMIDEQIIICDVNSIIIASTKHERLGDFHEGAAFVIKSKEQLIITKKLSDELKGVKMGVNFPLFFNKSIIGVIGITGDAKKIKPLGEIVRKMTELLINENHYNEQIEFKQRTIENLLFDLLQSKSINHSIRDRAETLGIDLDDRKQFILLSLNVVDSTTQKDVLNYITDIIPKKDVLVLWGNDRLLWMHTNNNSEQIKANFLNEIQSNCEKYFSIKLHIGVGDITNCHELKHSYQQSLTATNYSSLNSGISYYTDLQLELCLQDISSNTKKEFIKRTIGVLENNKQLLDTLRVFIEENASHQRTADQLFIHVNTLHYRLSSIHKLTNLNPKRFTDLATFYLALLLLDEYTIIK